MSFLKLRDLVDNVGDANILARFQPDKSLFPTLGFLGRLGVVLASANTLTNANKATIR